MKHLVSKVRTQKTKSREKQAIRASTNKLSIRDSQFIGGLITALLWLCCALLVDDWRFISNPADIALFLPMAGKNVLLLTGLLGTGLACQIIAPSLLHKNSNVLLLATISVFSLATIKALVFFTTKMNILPGELITFLIPLSIPPLLATILISSEAGIIVGLWNSIAAALLFNGSFPVLTAGIIVAFVAAHSARNVRTRTKVIKTGIIIGLCKIIFVISSAAVYWRDSNIMLALHESVACIASGFISAVIVLLILPVFEHLFQITTNISLLELADLGHPLLQRLAIEAPGTYHHSLVVANLAQAAADEVGANPLLTRISAYFHDIGKLTKPNFFAENIQLQKNPHDNLVPSMSTLVITAHVKEGLCLAVLHKLPPSIANVIREHHGTSLLSYFHHKAKTQLEFELNQNDDSDGQTQLDEGDFRYPGPKPSTRESAIICLADATEAASRTINKNTPTHIENLVNDIVFTRLKDGQLDDCDLTLGDLIKIKRSFVFSLTNMLHGRVPYPDDENRDKQQTKPVQDEQPEHKDPERTNS